MIPVSAIQALMARQRPGMAQPPSPLEQMYRQMIEGQQPQAMQPPAAPPPFLDRLAAGLTVPDAPTHPKHRGSQEFLRGLVGGFKGSRGFGAGQGRGRGAAPGGSSGRYVNEEYEQARADAARALAEQRRARAAEIGEPDVEAVDPLLEAKLDALKALAERRRRPDRPLAGRSGGRSKGKGGGSAPAAKSTYTSDKAQMIALGNHMKRNLYQQGADPSDPRIAQIDAWVQRQLVALARVESNRRRGDPRSEGVSGGAPVTPKKAAPSSGVPTDW